MPIKIALPKGRLLDETSALLRRAGWGLSGYHETARLYHLKSAKFPNLSAKVFHEKDIPIQVAVGNYDLGICGLDWVEELLVKYPSSALVKVKSLGYGESTLYMTASRYGGTLAVEELQAKPDMIRIASEYPNLAESFALNLRLRRFSIFPVWGAAEVYPPESADLVLIRWRENGELTNYGLAPVSKILDSSTVLIANKASWETKDKNMDDLLDTIYDESKSRAGLASTVEIPEIAVQHPIEGAPEDLIWLALPDGHQQLPTIRLLNKAGIVVDDYPSPAGNRRPTANLAGVAIKVIRPQDMPSQVANGNFDMAITGRDWLADHLYRFPSSPVKELLDLKYGKVRIVAVVSKDLPVTDVDGLRQLSTEGSVPFRVASEYMNIADKYAWSNHFGFYRVIPTWGASEAFLPEDADLLIENTDTGRTIARHNLKIIDTLFGSTACLIGNTDGVSDSGKAERIVSLTERLRIAVEEG